MRHFCGSPMFVGGAAPGRAHVTANALLGRATCALASGKALGIPRKQTPSRRRMRRMLYEKTACSQKCHVDCTRMLH